MIVYMMYQAMLLHKLKNLALARFYASHVRELTFGAIANTFAHRPPGTFPSIFLRPAEIGPDIRVPIISPLAFSSTHAESSKLIVSPACSDR